MESTCQDRLFEAAGAAMKNAYSPYSHYCVGAAVMCDDEEVFAGCNVENASYGAAVCAERNAVFAAVAAGKRNITAIAVVSDGVVPYPCGICRQVLAELAPEAAVYLRGSDGKTVYTDVRSLLPNSFKLK